MIIAASLGLLYNLSSFAVSLNNAFDESPELQAIPYFFISFYIMSSICVVCYLAIIAGSIGLCRGSAACARLLAYLLIFEVVYFFSIASFWMVPSIDTSVGAATGVANGGLMIQFFLLMPIWIPIAFWLFGLYHDGISIDTTNNSPSTQPENAG